MSLVLRKNIFNQDPFINHFFDLREKPKASAQHRSINVDISEQEKHYELVAELAGFDKSDISVSIEDNILSIKAEKKSKEPSSDEKNIIRRERFFGSLIRSFDLGENINEEEISATFKNGLLSLLLPKKIEEKASRKSIEIS